MTGSPRWPFSLMDTVAGVSPQRKRPCVSFIQFCDEAATGPNRNCEQQSRRCRANAWLQVGNAVEKCARAAAAASASSAAARRRRCAAFMDHLAAFTRQRLAEEVAAAGVLFFLNLARPAGGTAPRTGVLPAAAAQFAGRSRSPGGRGRGRWPPAIWTRYHTRRYHAGALHRGLLGSDPAVGHRSPGAARRRNRSSRRGAPVRRRN